MTQGLKLLKEVTRNGKSIFKSEDLELINFFENLGEGFMERKDITRLGKLLDRATTEICKQILLDSGLHFACYFQNFRTEAFKSSMKFHVDETYSYYTKPTPEKQVAVDALFELAKILTPVADKFYLVYMKRWMQNGKIPKTLQTPTEPTEVLKHSSLNEDVKFVLLECADKIYDAYLQKFTHMAMMNRNRIDETGSDRNVNLSMLVLADGVWTVDTGKIKKFAEEIQGKFIFKLAGKLAGIQINSKLVDSFTDFTSAFNYNLFFKFENGDQFEIDGKSVINTSILGNAYMQFPTIFKNVIIGGNKIIGGELKIKFNSQK